TNIIVMGPWVHGGWSRGDGDSLGHVPFNSKTSEFYREKIELPFFEYYLKGEGKQAHPEAWVFETGTNVWRQYDTWPPKNTAPRSFFFAADEKLGSTPSKDQDSSNGYDEYLSDPDKPVPFMDGVTIGMAAEYMTADQRFASRRPDVLVY